MKNRKVVISGFGCSTPIGDSYASIEASLFDGLSGIKRINKYDTSSFKSHFAGIPDTGNHDNSCNRFKTTHDELYTRKAMENMLSSHAMSFTQLDMLSMGCFLGVDEPVIDIQKTVTMANLKNKKNSAFEEVFKARDFFRYDPTSALCTINEYVPFKGPSSVHLGLCSASLQAIGMGFQAVRYGRVNAAIAGGISAKVTPEHYIGLESVDIIATHQKLLPTEISRPFDTRRSGYVPAEGAVLFLIETIDSCIESGREPLLEIVGFGTSTNSSHIVKPALDNSEMVRAMSRALSDAHLLPRDIDVINAHGTSTILNEYHESQAICSLFGRNTLVTANKSLHGHMIAAAGAMETLNTLISLRSGFIPGTINLDEKDPRCLANIIPHTKESSARYCLKNSFGMGGLAASMIFKRIEK